MGVLNALGYLITQRGKYPRKKIVASQSFSIFDFKKFLSDDVVGIDEEISRPGHSLILPSGLGVEHVVRFNHFRISVAKQGEINLTSIGKRFQDCRAVIADP